MNDGSKAVSKKLDELSQLKVLDQACSVFDIVGSQSLNHTHGSYFGITR